jgi:hypothetical protein
MTVVEAQQKCHEEGGEAILEEVRLKLTERMSWAGAEGTEDSQEAAMWLVELGQKTGEEGTATDSKCRRKVLESFSGA